MDIIDFIPIGHENGINRNDLCKLTGMSDRVVRRMIEKARKSNVIINLGDGSGYFRPGKGEDHYIRISRKMERNRCYAIRENIRTMDKALKKNERVTFPGQICMFE